MTALVGAWHYLSAASTGFASGSIGHLLGRQRMISKAKSRLAEIRGQLLINVTPEMVQMQLQRAEQTGQMSPLQRGKIYASMRMQIDAANSRVIEIDEKLDRVSYNVETLARDLDSVETEIRFAKSSMDADRLTRAEAKKQEIEAKRAKQQDELSRLKKQAEDASHGTAVTNERLMTIQKAERTPGAPNLREGSGNENNPAGSDSTGQSDSVQGQQGSPSDSHGTASDNMEGEPAGIILIQNSTGRSKKVSDPFDDELISGDQ